MGTQPLKVCVQPLVQFLRVNTSFIASEVMPEQANNDRCRVGVQQPPCRVALLELGETQGLSNGRHVFIVDHSADIIDEGQTDWLSSEAWARPRPGVSIRPEELVRKRPAHGTRRAGNRLTRADRLLAGD